MVERCALRSTVATLVMSWVLGIAPFAAAQSVDTQTLSTRPIPLEPILLLPEPPYLLSQQRMLELEEWTRKFDEWEKWADRWLNRRQPGLLANSLERKQKPDPPLWLQSFCDLAAEDEQLARPCQLLGLWREDFTAMRARRAAAALLSQQETPTKGSWWRHVHLDGLWSTTQSNSAVFGLFGAHVTADVEGRVQVFVAPGVMLMSVPGLSGNRELWPATDWGVTYRLFNVGQHTVHLNLVHAWILGSPANLTNPNMTLAGFSVTLRPSRR